MDLATLVGLISAFGIILAAIFLGGSAATFFNVPSLLVVFGGTVGAVLMQFSIAQFFGAMKVALKAFFNKSLEPEDNRMLPHSTGRLRAMLPTCSSAATQAVVFYSLLASADQRLCFFRMDSPLSFRLVDVVYQSMNQNVRRQASDHRSVHATARWVFGW